MAKRMQAADDKATTVTATFPIATETTIVLRKHIELQLSAEEAEVVRQVFGGLQARGERRSPTSLVDSHAQTIKWMLAQMAKSITA